MRRRRLTALAAVTLWIGACDPQAAPDTRTAQKPAAAARPQQAELSALRRAWPHPVTLAEAHAPVRTGTRVALRTPGGVLAARALTNGTLAWRRRPATPLKHGICRRGQTKGLHGLDANDAAVAFDTRDGTTRWRQKLRTATDLGPACTARAVIYASRNGQIVALSPQDGKRRWQRNIEPHPLAVTADDDLLTILAAQRTVHALAVESGNTRWRAWTDTDLAAQPLLSPSHVIVADQAGVLHGFARRTGTRSWRYRLAARMQGAPLLTAGARELYVLDRFGFLHALSPVDGSRRWRRKPVGAGAAAPIAWGGRLFLAAEQGLLPFAANGATTSFRSLPAGTHARRSLHALGPDHLGLIDARARLHVFAGR